MSTNARLLIFSKDRASQLLALLESLKSMCLEFETLDIVVLMKTSTDQHKKQYEELEAKFSDIYFYEETVLSLDINILIMKSSYIVFFVDDSICVLPFSVNTVIDKLEKHSNVIGFSLRLGENITYSYPHSCNQKCPSCIEIDEDIRQIDWTESECDFRYPMEVSSSIYRTSDVQGLLYGANKSSVQHIENSLWLKCVSLKGSKPNLMFFSASRAFANPMNITHNNNGNRYSDIKGYSAKEMADKFDAGFKIDVKSFEGFVPISCHQEVPFSWVSR